MSHNDEALRRKYVLLFKLDAQNLFNRLSGRKNEYLTVFAIKRSREHFQEIFKSRYNKSDFVQLAFCSEETIISMDEYYNHIDDIKWYLDHTEDMPATVEDELSRKFNKLEILFDKLMIEFNHELDFQNDSEFDEFESEQESEEADEESYETQEDKVSSPPDFPIPSENDTDNEEEDFSWPTKE